MSSVCVFFPSVLSPVCFYTFSIYLSFCFYLLLLPLQSSVSFHSYFPYSFLFCSFFSCICNDLHTRFFSPSSVICHQHFKENRHNLVQERPTESHRVWQDLLVQFHTTTNNKTSGETRRRKKAFDDLMNGWTPSVKSLKPQEFKADKWKYLCL